MTPDRDPRPGSDLYDDPSFFARYQLMRAARSGLNDELEQPALARLLLPVHGASVVELGCGDGALARRLASAGARDVLAVDSAQRMLALAARQPHPRVRYWQHDIETLHLPAASADCVHQQHRQAPPSAVGIARPGRTRRPAGRPADTACRPC